MFDVGFSELVVIGIVALLVLGPERLPKVARTAGLWAGRARRFLASVKSDIDRELKAEELRQIMEKQAKSTGIHEFVEEARTAVDEVRSVASATLTSPPAAAGDKTPVEGGLKAAESNTALPPAAAPGNSKAAVKTEDATATPTMTASPDTHERK